MFTTVLVGTTILLRDWILAFNLDFDWTRFVCSLDCNALRVALCIFIFLLPFRKCIATLTLYRSEPLIVPMRPVLVDIALGIDRTWRLFLICLFSSISTALQRRGHCLPQHLEATPIIPLVVWDRRTVHRIEMQKKCIVLAKTNRITTAVEIGPMGDCTTSGFTRPIILLISATRSCNWQACNPTLSISLCFGSL